MEEEAKPGAPMWIVTFADLMSLLMCFFVMLLSMASMDAMKFKQVAESLEKAFGVQRETTDLDPPKGTSPDFKHFVPGKPSDLSSDTVRQATTDEKSHLETFSRDRGLSEQTQAVADKQLRQVLEQIERRLVAELADVRKLCPNCAIEHKPTPQEIRALSISGDFSQYGFKQALGCEA